MKKLTLLFILCSSLFAKDSIVIMGGGIAGLTSGIYLARAGFKPVIIEGTGSSQITQSSLVENWPGEKLISGGDLIEKLKDQALYNGCSVLSKDVVSVDFSSYPFKINVKGFFKSEIIYADNCIIAMGSSPNKLNVVGESTYWAKGVSSCALCDGSLYKDKNVAVVGGGDAALVEANYLANLAKKVYVIIRKNDFKKTVDQKNKQMLLNKKNVEILYESVVTEILGDKTLTSVKVRKAKDNKVLDLKIEGLFIATGSTPNTDVFKGQIKLDNNGYIIVQNSQTSKKGVFAAGDIVSNQKKQAVIASASGAMAAIEIIELK